LKGNEPNEAETLARKEQEMQDLQDLRARLPFLPAALHVEVGRIISHLGRHVLGDSVTTLQPHHSSPDSRSYLKPLELPSKPDETALRFAMHLQ